jgi:hypothetical protein
MPLGRKHWDNLAKKLRREGFLVIQSYVRQDYKIKGVQTLPDDMALVIAFAVSCARVYSLRNGICDLIKNRARDLTVFYPNAFSYRVYHMPEHGVKNVLARNIYGEIKRRIKRRIKTGLKKIPPIKQLIRRFTLIREDLEDTQRGFAEIYNDMLEIIRVRGIDN